MQIFVKVHQLFGWTKPIGHDLTSLLRDIEIIFNTCFFPDGNIKIRLRDEGEKRPSDFGLPIDPVELEDYEKICSQIKFGLPRTQKIPGSPVHLLLAKKFAGTLVCRNPNECVSPSKVNGYLIDNAKRSLGAIFTQSEDLFTGNYSKLLQTCVHEIGHLFNLIHDDGDISIPTAMCAQQHRNNAFTRDPNQSFKKIWEEKCLISPWPNVQAFPFFSNKEKEHMLLLRGPHKNEVLPWGNSFRESLEI